MLWLLITFPQFNALTQQLDDQRMLAQLPATDELMSKSYVIEVGDDQAGVIVREDGEREYQFHAALRSYHALEGRRFANALLAERAAIAHAVSRRRRRHASAALEGASL
mgnify:FL=1